MIEVDIRHRQGDFDLAARFAVDGGLTALFGASGSGKTTLVRMLAGLTRPDEGVIRFGDAVWSDAERGEFTPPHRRRIGYVFQESLLFPHLSARQNLLYGRFFSRGESRIRESDVVDLLGVSRLLAQRPATLSGGERQRIAIGRALLSNPQLILMDEPLSALDRARKGRNPALYRAHPRRVRHPHCLCQPFRRGSCAARQPHRVARRGTGKGGRRARRCSRRRRRPRRAASAAGGHRGAAGRPRPLLRGQHRRDRRHLITIQEVAAPIGAMLRLRIPAVTSSCRNRGRWG